MDTTRRRRPLAASPRRSRRSHGILRHRPDLELRPPRSNRPARVGHPATLKSSAVSAGRGWFSTNAIAPHRGGRVDARARSRRAIRWQSGWASGPGKGLRGSEPAGRCLVSAWAPVCEGGCRSADRCRPMVALLVGHRPPTRVGCASGRTVKRRRVASSVRTGLRSRFVWG
jgi:hypothetical protein